MIWPVVVQALVGSKCDRTVFCNIAIASKDLFVAAEHHLIVSRQLASDLVVSVRVGGVEVKDKDEVAPLHDYELVALILLAHKLVGGSKGSKG